MDKFILNKKDQSYKKKIKLEKEERKREDKHHKPTQIKQIKQNDQNDQNDQKDVILYKNQDMKKESIGVSVTHDFFHIREKGDNLLNNWIIKQNEPIIIFLSEFIPGTKVSKEIEQFRPIIKTTPTISVDEYRKIKKIGEEGVEYLKRLKEKYGIIVLKVLWANLNFNV
jgi:hypothetical protein